VSIWIGAKEVSKKYKVVTRLYRTTYRTIGTVYHSVLDIDSLENLLFVYYHVPVGSVSGQDPHGSMFNLSLDIYPDPYSKCGSRSRVLTLYTNSPFFPGFSPGDEGMLASGSRVIDKN
jgi:hypothetical protein